MKRIIVWITVLSMIIAGVFAMNACNRKTDANGVTYEVNTPARDELSRVIITYGEQPEDYLSRITITKIENGVSSTVPVEPSMMVTTIDTSVVDGSGQILQFTYSGQMFSIPVVVKYKVEFVANGIAYRTYHVHNKVGLDNIKSLLEEEARAASDLGDKFNPNKLKLHELLVAPEKAGYNFVGWSFDDPDTAKKVKIENNFISVINDNVTYTAVYEPEMSEIPALSVIDAIYGENLADVKLPSSELGQWQFKDAEGTVGNVGENTFEVQFVESATGNVLAEGTVVINVVKQDAPELPELPVIEAVYGDLLADIVLPSFEIGAWQFENAEGTVGNAGENTFVVQFVDAQTNEVLEARTITVVVAKKTVNFLNVVESFSYNGEVQIPTFQTDAPELDVTHIQFNGIDAIDADTYDYSFVIVDDNYEGTLEGTYQILPAVINVVIQIEKDSISVGQDMPAITFEVFTTDGESAAELAGLISIVEPKIDGVGEYTITATTSNSNIKLAVTPATLTVALGKLNVGAPTFVSTTTTYGETLSTILFEDHPHGWWEWANPNDFVGDVIPAEDWEGHLAIFTPLASGKYAKEYYYVKDLNVNPKKLDIVVDRSDDIGGIAGTITVDYAPGTAWSILYNIVENGTSNPYADPVLKVYYTYDEVNFDAISFENAGKYIVTLNLEGGSNYEKVTASVILDVRKIDPEFEVETTLTETWKPELTLGQIALPTAPNGQFVWGNWLNGEEDAAAASELLNANDDFYFRTATFIPNDEVNYNRVVVTFQVKVNKAITEIEGINNSYEFIYNGSVYTISGATVNPDKYVDTPVFTYTNKADGTPFAVTEAGTYTLVVTLLESESGNYEGAQIEVTVTVAKADPQKPVQLQNAVYGDLLLEQVVLPEHAEGVWSFVGADATTTVGAVGQKVFVAIFTPSTGNYNSIEVPVTVEVAKKYISVPKISDSNKTQVYTGALLTSGLMSAEGYTVTDLGGINVGTYKVQIVLDTASYAWSSFGTEDAFELEYNIVRADNAWTVEPTIKSAWTYGDTNGLSASELAEYKGIAAASYGEVVVLYAPQGTDAFSNVFPTAAGKYTVKFIVTDSNYNDLVRTIDFTINKKVVTVPTYTNTYLYTGSDIEVNIPMSDLYTVVGNSAKNAGKYVATLTLKDSANYTWSTSELDAVALAYEIRTSGVALTVTINGWTYGQVANVPTVNVEKTFSDKVDVIVEYSVDEIAWSTNVPTAAGTYTVRAKVEDTDNYNGAVASCKFTIAKANVTIDGVENTYSKNYDGAVFAVPGVTVSNSAAVKVAITKDGSAADTILGAGQYVITYNVAESANYFAATRTITVTVNKADVTISKPAISGWTYGENAKAPVVGFNESFAQINNNAIIIKYFTDAACTEETSTLVDAGTYYVKAIFAGDNNLNAAESEVTEFVIAQVVVDVPVVSDKAYNGENQTAGIANNVAYTVVDLGGTNVGTYTASVELVSNNYVWADGTSEMKVFTYAITPIANTEAFERVEYTATYGDLIHNIIALPTGVQGTWSIQDADADTTVGNAGVHTFKAIFTPDATGNYIAREITVTVTVAKAIVEKPIIDPEEYTGEHLFSGLVSNELYTVVDEGGTDHGEYDVVLTLVDTENYKWDISDEATIIVKFIISTAINKWVEAPSITTWEYESAGDHAGKATAMHGNVLIEYKLASAPDSAYSTELPTVPGDYVARFTTTDDNYTILSATKTFSITKRKITPPTQAQASFTYTGNLITSGLTDGIGYVVEEEGRTNVGSFIATVSLTSEHYVWADGTSADKVFTYSITSATNNQEVVSAYTATYGDLLKDLITLPEGIEGTWSIQNMFDDTTVGNAGTNTFKAIFTPDATGNYNSREVTITVTVDKKVVNVPTEYTNAYTYTGEDIVVNIPTSDLYTVANGTAKNAGDYNAILTLVDGDNYKWNTTDASAVTLSYSIAKATVTLSNLTIVGWTYGQEANAPEVILTKDFADAVTVTYEYLVNGTWVESAPTDAGTYTVKAEVAGTANYTGVEITLEFTIAKASVVINGANDSYTTIYNGNAFAITGINASNGATVDKVITKGGEVVDTIIGAGEYVVTYSVAESANYQAAIKQVSVTVNKANVTISDPTIAGWTYSEAAKTPSASFGETFAQESNSEIIFKYFADAECTIEIEPINAGTYYVKAVFAGNDNLNAIESTVTSFVIAKKAITVPNVTDKVYNGKNQNAGISANEGYTVSDNGGTNVGSYTAVVALVNANNYEWADGTTANKELTYSITKASVSFEDLAIAGWVSGKYDATANQPTVTVVKSFDGDVAVSFEYYVNGAWGTTVPTLAGDYAVRAIVAGTANYDGAVSTGMNFKVTAAVVAFPSVDTNLVYTGGAQKLTIAESNYYTVAGNVEHTAVGTYTVTVVPTSTYSFVWAGEEGSAATEKTITYTIAKANVTLSGLTMNNWTYNETASTPSVTIDKSFSDAVTVGYEYFKADGTSMGTTVPTSAGTYKVVATVAGTDNYNGHSVEKEFSINQATATWSTPTFTGEKNGKFYMNNFGYSTAGLTATHNGQTVSGTFAFGTPVFVAGTNASYIDLTFTPNDTTNYATVTKRYNVTFVTVAVNNTTGASYGSIEIALKEAVSGNTVQVKAHDPDLGPIYIRENVTVASGVTLILPYGVNGDGVNSISSDKITVSQSAASIASPASEELCHVKVIIAAGKTLTNNGTIQVAGQLSSGGGASPYSGFTEGEHARLVLDADAELINNGTIYAAGFIRELTKGNRSKVILNNGSVLYQPFTVKDFPGGSVSYAVYNTMGKNGPVTAYSRFILMNVSPETHINYGGTVKVWALLWANDQVNQSSAEIIGTDKTGAVIALTDATYSKIIAKYDVDTEVCDLDIYGGAKTNGMKLSIKVLTTVTINTADALFGISYHYDVSLNKSEGQETATFSMDQRFKIMTGAKFTVGEGVILNATELIAYEEFVDIRSDAGGNPDHPMAYPAKPAAIFTVNGTLNVDKFGGRIYSTVEGAQVNIKSASAYTAYEIDTVSGSSFTAKVDKKNPITERTILVGATNEVSDIKLATTYRYKNNEWIIAYISFDSNGGSTIAPIGVADVYPTLPMPVRDGYEFLGWYYNDELISVGASLKKFEDHTLTAKWKAEGEVWINVGLDSDGDGAADSHIQVDPANGMVYPSLPTFTKDGYKFIGWTYNGTTVTAGSALAVNSDHMLTAQWAQVYSVTVSTSNATVTGVTSGDKIAVGETVSVTVSFSQSKNKTFTVKDASGNTLLSKTANGTYTFTMPASDVTISASSESSTCVTPDTLVTLADGTQKRIDEVQPTDMLLVWNFYEGKYDVAPASILMNHGYDTVEVLTLVFADGTTIGTINGHGFFDEALNAFVIINTENVADFVGHSFVKVDGDSYTTTELVGYRVETRYTEVWSILTAVHYNAIIEGMWSVTEAEVPNSPTYLMPFVVGEGMKYDSELMQADIEKYGLYTYEDFAMYCTKEQFEALGLDIFKVAVGKGYITREQIIFLLETHCQ